MNILSLCGTSPIVECIGRRDLRGNRFIQLDAHPEFWSPEFASDSITNIPCELDIFFHNCIPEGKISFHMKILTVIFCRTITGRILHHNEENLV